MEKVPASVCNKRTIESLIKSGAFDSLGETRRALVTVHEDVVDEVIQIKRNEAAGQFDLFSMEDDAEPSMTVQVPDLDEWEKKDKLGFEREMLGLYVSDHPLQGLEHVLAANRDLGIQQLTADDGPRDGVVTICGMITGIQRKQTKDGKVWAILSVEDLDASIEVLVFNKAYAPVAMSLGTDVVVRIKGRLRDRDDSVELTASDVSFPDVSAGPSGPVTISLPTARCTPEVVEQLKFTLRQHPGTQEVRVRLVSPQRATVWRLDDRLRVQNTNSLVADLKALLGPSCVSA